MPVAETASTFNEVHLGKAARTEASGEELLNLLENDIKEQTQCIVDIYSRYLFETAVFEQSQNKFLMADDLKQIMLDAQKKTGWTRNACIRICGCARDIITARD